MTVPNNAGMAAPKWHKRISTEPWATRIAVLTVLILWLVAWELTVRAGLVSTTFAATPSQTLIAMIDIARELEPRTAFLSTIVMFIVAFGIAAATGLLAGAVMGISLVIHRIFHPICVGLFSTPKMIFIPLFILVGGFGAETKIAYAAISGFFPIVITVTAAVRMVDRRLLLAARSLGGSQWQVLRSVILPASLPAVLISMWYGMQHALIGILIMELFASQQGIGYFIKLYTGSFQPDKVFALVFAVAIFAIILGFFWRWQEKKFTRWQVAI